jgi:serine protease
LLLSATAGAEGRALVRFRGAARELVLDGDPADWARRPEVVFAEPDRARHPAAIVGPDAVEPDDPLRARQWALEAVRAPAAWARSTGSERVVVAVLDTGIAPHPDLDERLLPGYDFVRDRDEAGDGDGRDGDPRDPSASSRFHGLHVAGIVGAAADNGLGIAGLDWHCRILPVRVLGVRGGRGFDSDIADGIRWAAGLAVEGAPPNPTPADVINLSMTGEGRSQTLQRAIDDARAHGAVVVAAAGNDGVDARHHSPAGLDGVITVGALAEDGAQTRYSNFGPSLALWAPGGAIGGGVLSTGPESSYATLAGSSQAAAFVAGAASLLRALRPSLSPDAVRAVLVESARGGSLDLDGALALAQSCEDCEALVKPPVVVQGGCSPAPSRAPAGLLAVAMLLLALYRLRS